MNFQKSEVRGQTSEQNSQLSIVNSVKGRGPNGALRPQPSIELHIDELILHGFAPCNRYAVGDAVERELARLLHDQSIPISLQSQNAADEIKGATFNAAHNKKLRAIGRQIAQAVYQGFGK